jgi:dolichol-phosphate mannosyltransferase
VAAPVRLADRARFLKFAAVGISGVGVNSFFLWLFTDVVGIRYWISSPIAVELAILSNFFLNDCWTFRDVAEAPGLLDRSKRFHVTAAGGFVINWSVLVGLTHFAGLYYLLSNLVGILAGFLWNYTLNVKWTWKTRAGHPPR